MSAMDERGIVLPIVLLAVSLLMVTVLGFDSEARRELKEAAAFRDGMSAVALNRAALEAARAMLLQDTLNDLKAGVVFDGLTDSWGRPSNPLGVGEGAVAVSITDERGKLNINDLAVLKDPKQRQIVVARFTRLFSALSVDPRLVEAILDWVDQDDIPERNGAERSYYESLTPPYRPSNDALHTLEDLRLVRGMTEDYFQRLQRYLTVYPILSDGWININTADPLVIQSLHERVTPAMATAIVQARPFRNLKDLDKVTGVESFAKELRLLNAYDIWTDHFSVSLSVEIGGITKTGHAVLQRARTNGGSHVLAFKME
jgi:general secretion pathway protein K